MHGSDRRDEDEQEIRLREDLPKGVTGGEPGDRADHQREGSDAAEQHHQRQAGPPLSGAHLRVFS
jgi:hypothetical protein